MFVCLQAGYPDDNAINKKTAHTTGLPEGSEARFLPYLMFKKGPERFHPMGGKPDGSAGKRLKNSHMTNTLIMEGTKHDEGKLRWGLVPWDAFEEVVRVYTHGADKYGDNNWMGLEDAEDRYFSALMRHLVAWRTGERIDPDRGFKHLAQVTWNALALLWYTERP